MSDVLALIGDDVFLGKLAWYLGTTRVRQYDVCGAYAFAPGLYAVYKQRATRADFLPLDARTHTPWIDVYYDARRYAFTVPPDMSVRTSCLFRTADAEPLELWSLDIMRAADAFRDVPAALQCARECLASPERWWTVPIEITTLYEALEALHVKLQPEDINAAR